MDAGFIIQTATGIAVGLLTYFMKQTMTDIREDIKANNNRVEAVETKINHEICKLKDELNDLKTDMPIVFTLREDFIRALNNVDNKLDKLMAMQIESIKEERRKETY